MRVSLTPKFIVEVTMLHLKPFKIITTVFCSSCTQTLFPVISSKITTLSFKFVGIFYH